MELGSELLGIVETLEPGYTLKHGRILRQLHLPTLQLAKFNFKEKKISLLEFGLITRTIIKKMNDAVKCFEDFDLFIVSSGNMSSSDQKFSLNGNMEDNDTQVGICSIED